MLGSTRDARNPAREGIVREQRERQKLGSPPRHPVIILSPWTTVLLQGDLETPLAASHLPQWNGGTEEPSSFAKSSH